MTQESNSKAQQKPKIDKFALAKRFLNLGEQEQAKFIALLDAKGMSFEKLPIVSAEEVRDAPLLRRRNDFGTSTSLMLVIVLTISVVVLSSLVISLPTKWNWRLLKS